MPDDAYPKYTPLKWGFSYQLPEGPNFLGEMVADIRRRELERMELMLQEEVFMNFTDTHSLYDLPESSLTVIPASTARGIAHQKRTDILIEELGEAIMNSANLGKFDVRLTYWDKAEAESVAALARWRGYSTNLSASVMSDCWALNVSWK